MKGVWPPEEDINDLEMETIWLDLQHFPPELIGRHVVVMTD